MDSEQKGSFHMFTASLEKLGRTILMIALLALTLGVAACVGVDRGSDEAYADDPAALASAVTAEDPGHGDPEAPCCSTCGSVCNLYGSDSLECESCRRSCVRCSLAGSETMAQDPGHVDPEELCCESCGTLCRRYGPDSFQCESCWSSCDFCNSASADCEPAAAPAN